MVFKRRHHLKNTALELTDIHGYSLLFSCESETRCNDMLLALFEAELPASIFYSVIGMKNLQLLRGLSNMYNRLMSMFLSSMTARWQKGEISNFEYLMHLNAAAGRSFQDLTQYPVFPWILADYTSTVLDLTDPKTFRDLSKPMGALGLKRAKQYRDRYRTMDEFRRYYPLISTSDQMTISKSHSPHLRTYSLTCFSHTLTLIHPLTYLHPPSHLLTPTLSPTVSTGTMWKVRRHHFTMAHIILVQDMHCII